MKNLKLSDIYWFVVWIGLGFGVPEFLAWLKVIPMDTLSQTDWLNQSEHWWLADLVTGFLLGLIFHMRWQTGLWRTEALTILFIYAVDLLLLKK